MPINDEKKRAPSREWIFSGSSQSGGDDFTGSPGFSVWFQEDGVDGMVDPRKPEWIRFTLEWKYSLLAIVLHSDM